MVRAAYEIQAIYNPPGNVEGHTQTHVRGSLVQLTRQLA